MFDFIRKFWVTQTSAIRKSWNVESSLYKILIFKLNSFCSDFLKNGEEFCIRGCVLVFSLFFFVFHAKLLTIKNPRIELSDISD